MLAFLSSKLRMLQLRHVPTQSNPLARFDLLRRGLSYDIFCQEREASYIINIFFSYLDFLESNSVLP
jgi:hypothetical protein